MFPDVNKGATMGWVSRPDAQEGFGTMYRSVSFSEVSLVIAESDKARLQALRSTLYFLGFRETEWVETAAELEAAVARVQPDLVVTADVLPDGPTGRYIQRLRRGLTKADPFTPVISILSEASPDAVRRGINSGADDLIIHPWPQGYLDQRLEKLVAERKPFVVTSDYVGPDRRAEHRAGSGGRTVAAPNILGLRAVERRPRAEIQAELAGARANMEAQRLMALVELLVRLTGDIEQAAANGSAGSTDARTTVDRLIAAASEAAGLAPRCGQTGAVQQILMDIKRHGRLCRDAQDLGRIASLHDLTHLAEGLAERFGLESALLLSRPALPVGRTTATLRHASAA